MEIEDICYWWAKRARNY